MEYFILNGHSLPIQKDIEDRCLKQFFELYKTAMNHNFKQILIPNYMDPHWYEIQISQGRTIRHWINEQPRDYRTRIKSLIQSIECPLNVGEIRGPRISDFYYNGKSVPLLGAAYLLKQLAFSFNSDKIWNDLFFSLDCEELDSDIGVSNATTIEHWDIHFNQILEERKKLALTSDDIEKWIAGEFPHIIFTDNASRLLKRERSPVFLREFWEACEKLNEAIEKANVPISYYYIISETNLDISDESVTVKQNKKLSRHRKMIYDGESHYFWHHIKNFTGWKRVHFTIADNKIVIGYLGKHLPT